MAAGELVVSIIGDMRELSKTFSQAQTEIGNIGKEFEEMGKKLTNTGKTMSTYVTAPLVGIGAISLHTAANFDDAMRKVQAISGATGSDFEKLTNQARELGATTAFSATDAAEAMYYLALAGWDVNEIMEATPGLLALASAAGMDLGQAADIVSDTMSGFQMDATQAGEAANIFAAASSNSNTDVLQLGEALKYAGATANAAGMDLVQTTAILGVLADSGVKGSMAGTTLNAMLRDMKKAAVDGAIGIGTHTIALYNADGTMRDLGAVMADVGVATADMTVEQRDAALAAIFHEESIRGVNIMLATGSERYYELEGKIRDSDGAAKSMAETMEGGVGGALREMESAMEELMIVLGNILVIGVLPLIKYLTQLFGWFSELPAPIQKAVIAFGAAIAIIGPLIWALGAVVSAIGTLAAAFGTGGALAGAISFVSATLLPALSAALGLLISPIGLVIVAVAALALAWKNNWFDIQGKAQVVWSWIKTQANDLKNQLERAWHAIVMSVSTLKTQFGAAWDALKAGFTTIAGMLVSAAMGLYNGMVSAYNSMIASLTNLKTQMLTRWAEIRTGVYTKLTELINDAQTWLNNQQTKFNTAISQITDLKTRAIARWTELKSDIINKLNEIISDIQNWIDRQNDKFSQAVASVNDLKTSVINAFSDMLSEIRTKIDEIINAIKELPEKVKDLGTEAYNAGKALVQELIDGLKSKLQEVKNTVSEITKLSSISESSAAKSVKSAGSSVVNTIKSAGTKAKVSLAEAASGLKRLLPNSPAKEGPFKELPDWDFIFLDPLMDSINSVRKLSSPLSSALSGLRNPINSTSASGLRSVSNIANSNTYGGDTLNLGGVTISNNMDLQSIFLQFERWTAQRRRARGY